MAIDEFADFIQSAGVAILIGFVAYLGAFIIGMVIRKALQRPLGKTWSNFIASLVILGILIWAAKIILDYTGAAGAIVILATAVTGALIIGSERLSSDLLAGLNIFFTKPFEAGQYVEIAEYEGEVVSINLTTTHLNSDDGTRIILRNSTVIDSTIVNYSVNSSIRITALIPVPVSEDLDKAALVLQECLDSFEPQAKSETEQGNVVCEKTQMGYAEFNLSVFIPASESSGRSQLKLFVHAVSAIKSAGIKMRL